MNIQLIQCAYFAYEAVLYATDEEEAKIIINDIIRTYDND
jgi:hypothetical protein